MKKIIIVVAFVGLIVVVMVTLWKRNSSPPAPVPSQRVAASSGSAAHSAGNIILTQQGSTVMISASSLGRAIVGFDLVLVYDPSLVEVTAIQSQVPGFSIYRFNRDSGLTITGAKSLASKTNSVFNKTPLVTLSLRAKKSGTVIFKVVPDLGKEQTKLVDERTNILRPAAAALTVSLSQ